MKNLIVALLVLSGVAMAQNTTLTHYSDVYTPSTLYAGTSMSARALSTSFSDTTKAVVVRGYAAVYLGIETSANDSGRVLVGYRMSKDGVNFVGGFTAMDSLTTTGTVGVVKYFALPSAALGAYAVQFRAYGNADIARYSGSPSTLAAFKVIRVPYNLQKIQ
jgi:hypothetical protein